MHLWKTSELVAELRAGTVSEKDKMLYVLVTGIAYVVMSDPIFSIGLEYSTLDALGLALLTVITVLGTLYTYKRNREGDDRDFITRVACLAVPIGVRLLLVALIGGLVVGIIEAVLSGSSNTEHTYQTTPLQLGFVATITTLYYRSLGERIADVARGRDAYLMHEP
jgi:hypothetical protein